MATPQSDTKMADSDVQLKQWVVMRDIGCK